MFYGIVFCLFIDHWQKFGFFYFLTIIKSVSMNIYVQVSVWSYVCYSLVYLPSSGISGSYGETFNFSEDLQNCFSMQLQHFTFSLAIYKNSNFSTISSILVIILLFLFIYILMYTKWNFILLLICIF